MVRRAALFALVAVPFACGGAPPPGGLMGEAERAPAPVATTAPVVRGAKDEGSKIHQLIELVRASNMTFIRNGEPHDAGEAATHLASKVEHAADPKMTARDFIQRIASYSSRSNQPYLVRLPDGKTLEAKEWLLARLAEIESAP